MPIKRIKTPNVGRRAPATARRGAVLLGGSRPRTAPPNRTLPSAHAESVLDGGHGDHAASVHLNHLAEDGLPVSLPLHLLEPLAQIVKKHLHHLRHRWDSVPSPAGAGARRPPRHPGRQGAPSAG